MFRTRGVEDDLREEIEFHLAARTEYYVREGLNVRNARERARREFGSSTAVVERARDANIAVWLEGMLQDIGYAGRQIRRS
ncbi:MAG TPA: permease prefix domain 1-containing protein, partial [Bryobacteraceae bacterium]|nr:permease prefix domain 1-containing protein [Bryobacteraceae bacterium]